MTSDEPRASAAQPAQTSPANAEQLAKIWGVWECWTACFNQFLGRTGGVWDVAPACTSCSSAEQPALTSPWAASELEIHRAEQPDASMGVPKAFDMNSCDEGVTMAFLRSRLLRDNERTRAAIASPGFELALDIANNMADMSSAQMQQWASHNGLHHNQSISFFPPQTEGKAASITVAVLQAGAAAPECSLAVEKYGMRFFPLTGFYDWCPETHTEFVSQRLFAKATDALQAGGLAELLVPMHMYTGRGVLLKHHIPQPELNDGTPNPHAPAEMVWTVSVTDDKPPEVLKIGKLDGKLLVLPWNPSAADICLQREELEYWVTIKNAHFAAVHYLLP